jgi:hypothetical protein
MVAGLPLPQLADLVWQGTAQFRRELHRSSGSARCPGSRAPYGSADPNGQQVPDSCLAAGCLDLVHEVLMTVQTNVQRRLEAGTDRPAVDDLARYANVAVSRAVSDLGRRRRVARGLPAKPTRVDGVGQRVLAALSSQAPDAQTEAWWITLFRLVRAYPCRPGSPGRGWPLDAWAEEKTRLDGRSRVPGSREARAEIETDIKRVLRTVGDEAGHGWRHENITLPLIAGSDPVAAEELPDWHPDHPVIGPPDEQVLRLLFEDAYCRFRSGGSGVVSAFRSAAAEVYGKEPVATVSMIRALSQDLERAPTVARLSVARRPQTALRSA